MNKKTATILLGVLGLLFIWSGYFLKRPWLAMPGLVIAILLLAPGRGKTAKSAKIKKNKPVR